MVVALRLGEETLAHYGSSSAQLIQIDASACPQLGTLAPDITSGFPY